MRAVPYLCLLINLIQPAVFIFCFAGEEAEEGLLNAFGNRAATAFTNLNTVYTANRCDLSRRTGHKDFIGQIQGFAGQNLFTHFDTQIFRQLNECVTGNTRQAEEVKRRGEQDTVFTSNRFHRLAVRR